MLEGGTVAYFDNAATTFPKPDCVYVFMDKFYRQYGANAGRGTYSLSNTASVLIDNTRLRIQNLLHCPAKQVVFTPSATIALNIIIQGVMELGTKNIYITPFEHNAVTRTLHHFEKLGLICVNQLSVSNDLKFNLEKIKYQFDAVKPDFIIMSHASNVIGLVAPITDIAVLSKKYNAITLIDMSTTAGLIDCNIGLDVFDFAVFNGHKTLYGPTGIAGFVMNPEIKLPAVLFGGTGFESFNQDMPESLPEKYEMGTTNIVGIAGLNAALKWLDETTMYKVLNKEIECRARLIALLSKYPFIRLIGNQDSCEYVGIVSCCIDDISSDSAGIIFNHCNIAVRTGLHCAPLAHKFLGTYPAGTIRLSVSYFTSDDDFCELKKALDYIGENL